MKIVVATKEDVLEERSKLTKEVVDLIRKQAISNHRYAKKMNALLNRITRLEDEFYGK